MSNTPTIGKPVARVEDQAELKKNDIDAEEPILEEEEPVVEKEAPVVKKGAPADSDDDTDSDKEEEKKPPKKKEWYDDSPINPSDYGESRGWVFKTQEEYKGYLDETKEVIDEILEEHGDVLDNVKWYPGSKGPRPAWAIHFGLCPSHKVSIVKPKSKRKRTRTTPRRTKKKKVVASSSSSSSTPSMHDLSYTDAIQVLSNFISNKFLDSNAEVTDADISDCRTARRAMTILREHWGNVL